MGFGPAILSWRRSSTSPAVILSVGSSASFEVRRCNSTECFTFSYDDFPFTYVASHQPSPSRSSGAFGSGGASTPSRILSSMRSRSRTSRLASALVSAPDAFAAHYQEPRLR
jgi:hypothetical protein